jgi:hypothetical protein
MDPKKVLKNRKAEVKDTHIALFDGVGSLIKGTLDFCERRGYGKVSKLYAIQGAAEAAMYGLSVAIEHRSEAKKVSPDNVSYDSLLFAALYIVMTADYVQGRPHHTEGRELEATHDLFRKITGHGFRDCFIDLCKCENCKARRKEHGIKYNPDPIEGWL